jgi:hypothetical protein
MSDEKEKELLKRVGEHLANSNKNLNLKLMQIKETSADFSKMISDVHNSFSKLAEVDRQRKKTYLDNLLLALENIEGPLTKCEFILKEKSVIGTNVIRAKLKGDGYERKFLENVISDIIEPFLKQCQEELVLENQKVIAFKSIPSISSGNKCDSIIAGSKAFQKSNENLPEGFSQIECSATEDQIMNYFMILSKAINPAHKMPYMKPNDVEELVWKNFRTFDRVPVGGHAPINLTGRQKGVLRYFMYEFYAKYELNLKNTKRKYVDFLIWNFELFKDDDPQTLYINMATSKRPQDFIDMKKHL